MGEDLSNETPANGSDEPPASSFTKSLFRGELHDEMLSPYPRLSGDERVRADELIAAVHEVAERHHDPWEIERRGWIGDEFLAALGEEGLLGLSVPTELGGQGLSQTAYCRVSEEFGRIDGTLAVVMGVHQSLGTKAIQLFGTQEQRERWLPDLARGSKLAAFALTEPGAGSDASSLATRATPQADGSWRLDGEKRWIGNGDKDVLVAFASIVGEDGGGHIALVVEQGMEGLSSPFGYETMGLKGNALRHVRFDGVRVPPENVLGEPGEGFGVAMHVLNHGRMSLGTGAVGGAKRLLELAINHTRSRRQFGHPLADFGLVREKVAWTVAHTYAIEAMAYQTTGLHDAGVPDVALESAMVKIASTEFLWYAANRAFQLAGGSAYMAGSPYEKILRDIRVYPIFEGANDVLRLFVAMAGLKPLGDELREVASFELTQPVRTIGLIADYVLGRVQRELRSDRMTSAHASLSDLAQPVASQVGDLRGASEQLLRRHGRGVTEQQGQLKRLAHVAMDLYAQAAVVSRLTRRIDEVGVEMVGEERELAETFCARSQQRVRRHLRQLEDNDDDRLDAIARVAYEEGGYRYDVFR
ncbi:acyl-CoA dehydrogenase [Egibacter rhizosphaerae]|uniref:Acyl-CoA dehydrogenase n=1 Tax=Egibacter rhizosphaerae TaxID=1670831 RepID=A0A411YHF3_9ACTN|nr:acyl-CoA dehydrogenase family protein [Egibacter rhizosphaerae]QBI20653.1 acyl-CoA dehydrogenase [Egibacter rhizosphaerae]